MLGIGNILIYILGAAIIIVSPGPDFIYVTTRGIAQGKRAGIISAAGISIGLMIHTALAAFGLSALLQTSGFTFQMIKIAGALYLGYLGIRMIFDKKTLIGSEDPELNGTVNSISVFRQGMLTNVLNPKAIITFMAFIPQFINPQGGNPVLQIVILGGVISLLAVLWFGCIGYFAGTVGQWLLKKQSVQKAIKKISGVILIGLGVKLAVTRIK